MVKLLKIFLFLVFITTYNLQLTTYNLFAQDKIAAIVNNDVITQKDLDDFINFMRIQISRELKGKELESKIQSIKLDLLDKLIEDRLILQEAKKGNIKIDENRVRARIGGIKKNYPSDAQFQDALRKQGLVQADIEAKIREQLLMYSIIDIKVKSKIVINPGDVTDFYQQNTSDFKTSEEREFEALTIKDEKLAKEAYLSLKGGQGAEEAAKKYSLDISKLSAAKNGQLRKEIEEAVFGLKLGEISQPLSIEGKFYIFKLNNILPERAQSFTEVKDTIYDFLSERKMQEDLAKWLEGLKKHAFIQILPN